MMITGEWALQLHIRLSNLHLISRFLGSFNQTTHKMNLYVFIFSSVHQHWCEIVLVRPKSYDLTGEEYTAFTVSAEKLQPQVPKNHRVWWCERSGHQHQGETHHLQCQRTYDWNGEHTCPSTVSGVLTLTSFLTEASDRDVIRSCLQWKFVCNKVLLRGPSHIFCYSLPKQKSAYEEILEWAPSTFWQDDSTVFRLLHTCLSPCLCLTVSM